MWKLIAIVVVILIVVGVAAYILTQNTAPPANIQLKDDGTCTPTPPDAACLFTPASYNAAVNGAVVWKNTGTAPHTVTGNSTANTGLPAWAGSSTLSGGNTYSFTFTTAGTYHYYCNIHQWMKGVIIVK